MGLLGTDHILYKGDSSYSSYSTLICKHKLLHGSVKESMLTSNVQFVNHLLETFATDDIIAEHGTKIVRFIKQANMSPLKKGRGL